MNWTLGGNPVGDLEYAYDADGRVIQKTGSLASSQLPSPVSGNTFNADNEMTAFDGTAMTYDADGNLTNDGTNSYLWDARGHLSTLAGTNLAAYQYDAFGRRVENTLNGVMTQYLYDGLNPVQELNGASPPNPTATMLTGLNIDEYFQRTDSSGTMSYLTDMLGSTVALADSSGNLNTTYTYEPFGNTTVSGSSGNPYQFTGRDNDGTGLYYYRARYYSPMFQRFVAQDPIGFASGPNFYAYVSNDPADTADASGLGDLVSPPPGTWGPWPRAFWKVPPKNVPPTDIRPLLPRDAPNCTAPLPWWDTAPLDPLVPWVIPIKPFQNPRCVLDPSFCNGGLT